jgi:hypothetical protein
VREGVSHSHWPVQVQAGPGWSGTGSRLSTTRTDSAT